MDNLQKSLDLVDEGRVLLREGDVLKAISKFRNSLIFSTDNIYAHRNLVTCFTQIHQYEYAIFHGFIGNELAKKINVYTQDQEAIWKFWLGMAYEKYSEKLFEWGSNEFINLMSSALENYKLSMKLSDSDKGIFEYCKKKSEYIPISMTQPEVKGIIPLLNVSSIKDFKTSINIEQLVYLINTNQLSLGKLTLWNLINVETDKIYELGKSNEVFPLRGVQKGEGIAINFIGNNTGEAIYNIEGVFKVTLPINLKDMSSPTTVIFVVSKDEQGNEIHYAFTEEYLGATAKQHIKNFFQYLFSSLKN